MKTSFFLVIGLLFLLGCTSENKEDVITAVAAKKMNVLYVGVDNPITIAVSAFSNNNLDISTDNGDISGENGKYIVRPRKIGMAEIQVNNGDLKLGAAKFRVKSMPDPKASLAGKIGGNIEMEELLEQEKLNVFFPVDFDVIFEISGFWASIEVQGFTIDEKSETNKFTEAQRTLLSRVKPGDQFLISEIKAIGPDGNERELPPLLFKIKPNEPETHFEKLLTTQRLN